MDKKRGKLLWIAAYTVFGGLAFLIFFYWTFPFSVLEKRMLDILALKSGCVVTIEQSRYSLPARMSGNGLAASCPTQGFGPRKAERIDLDIATFDFSLAPFALLAKQRGEVDFQARIGGGDLSGHLTIIQKNGLTRFELSALDGRGLDIAKIGAAGAAGRLDLKGEGAWSPQDPTQGTGRLTFSLEQGRIKELLGRPLPIGELTFSMVEGRLFWKGDRIVLEAFSAKGALADLQSELGNLLLRSPIDNSLLTLSLRAEPKGSLKEMATLFIQGYSGREPMKVRANGPLRAPQISVNGKTVRLES